MSVALNHRLFLEHYKILLRCYLTVYPKTLKIVHNSKYSTVNAEIILWHWQQIVPSPTYISCTYFVSCQYYFHTRVSMLSINFTSSILYNFTCAIHNLCIYIIYVIIHLVARYVFIHIFISTIILFYYIHNAYFINCAIFFNELVQKSHHVEY